jgi:hypothetical protein
VAEPKIHVIEFPDSSGGDVPACAELTAMLVLTCHALAESWGWPAVLDSMLSAYLSVAVPQVGKERMERVLGHCQSHLDQFVGALDEGETDPRRRGPA